MDIIWLRLQPRASWGCLASILPEHEICRANRFRNPADAQAFLSCRALLRVHIGQRLGVNPKALDIVIDDLGKPRLRDLLEYDFSISHSGEFAVVGCADGLRIGVDVQRHEDLAFDINLTASQVFSASELKTLATAANQQCFFALWTRKEAALKAVGTGFRQDAREINVARPPPLCDRLIVGEAVNISAPDGYSAAVATARIEVSSSGPPATWAEFQCWSVEVV